MRATVRVKVRRVSVTLLRASTMISREEAQMKAPRRADFSPMSRREARYRYTGVNAPKRTEGSRAAQVDTPKIEKDTASSQ